MCFFKQDYFTAKYLIEWKWREINGWENGTVAENKEWEDQLV